MFRKHYPDLDLLESPLISASPFGTMLGGVPGSAIAEKIFNDPESWHDSDEENTDNANTKDPMAWLAEELEKYHGDEMGSSPIERNTDITLRPFSGRYKVTAKPSLTLPSLTGVHTKWEGIQEDEQPPYLPIFERSGLDLSLDLNLRLSKILETGGNIFRSFPSPVTFSPPPSPSPIEPNAPNPPIKPSVSSLNLETIMERDSPIVSPTAITATSTTWSILELYGVPPTPRLASESGRSEVFRAYPPTPVPPVPRLPAYLQNTPPTQRAVSPLPKPPCPPARETTPIRRLPVIPGCSCDSSPTPSRINTPDLVARKASLPLPPPPQSYPEPATRNASLPLSPPSSCQDPFSPPSVAQSTYPNRSPAASRSPPAGPRPRSSTLPKTRPNISTGRESPFTISPAPSRTRRSPSPAALPPIRCGVRI